MDIRELFQFTSKPVAVLGGGPSCPDDIKQLPEGCIYVAVNHHAFKLFKPDYVCHLDSPRVNVPIKTMYEEHPEVTKVTKFPDYTDIDVSNVHFINEGDSGQFAVWFACYISSGPVYLCGFGLRQPGKMHFHGDMIQAGVKNERALKHRVGKWQLVWPRFYRPERIKAISGPLKDYKPEYVNRQIIEHPKIDSNIMVCGGGPSLPEDIKKLRGRVKYMAVNYHATKLVNCHWMVFMDDYEISHKNQQEVLQKDDFTKISFVSNPYTNYFTQYQSPVFKLSGHLAVWVASYITKGRIFLGGFDLYQGKEHFHDDEEEEVSSWGGPSIDKKIAEWQRVFEMIGRDRIDVLSGPLRNSTGEK